MAVLTDKDASQLPDVLLKLETPISKKNATTRGTYGSLCHKANQRSVRGNLTWMKFRNFVNTIVFIGGFGKTYAIRKTSQANQ